ncbi:MAG: HIT domain-containing protein [Syntrophales bacterium]
MEPIFAPWRIEYIRSKKPDGCIFCEDSIRMEEFVLLEGETSYVMMNLYPYTSGHLMIIPFRHVSNVEELSSAEQQEMFDFVNISVKVLKEALKPEGFNIGMNLGTAAGAGVEDHLHAHVVPRWCGDNNFMSVLGEVRVIPEDISGTWEILKPYFDNLPSGGLK